METARVPTRQEEPPQKNDKPKERQRLGEGKRNPIVGGSDEALQAVENKSAPASACQE